jgi:hypothetical protein
MTVGEWDERQLCPDGACIGVIGADGTCKVCGRVAPNWGDERRRGLIADGAEASAEDDEDADDDYEDDDGEDGDDEDDEDGDGEDGDGEDGDEAGADEDDEDDGKAGAIAASAEAGEDDADDRELCSDGACIGVIGADGKCKVCGKPGERAARPVELAAVAVITEPVITEPVITDAVITEPAPSEPAAPAEPEASSSDPESNS